MHTGGVQAANFLCHQGATQDRRQAQLIATGDKNTGSVTELFDIFLAIGIGALANRQRNSGGDADLLENFDLAIAGIGQV
jgi:hypothetical protein